MDDIEENIEILVELFGDVTTSVLPWIGIIHEGCGQHFDPDVVDAFMELRIEKQISKSLKKQLTRS